MPRFNAWLRISWDMRFTISWDAWFGISWDTWFRSSWDAWFIPSRDAWFIISWDTWFRICWDTGQRNHIFQFSTDSKSQHQCWDKWFRIRRKRLSTINTLTLSLSVSIMGFILCSATEDDSLFMSRCPLVLRATEVRLALPDLLDSLDLL